ncbi:CRISPR type III-B/RAMP module RAMP protein Cmr6 [Paenibacillus sp. 32O-W]|uniref:type III-B CRISPR module RAMP protein Cmr6 n=1 Tax=Paenibacillus sp. 32O-W TaxID=1695218 RepID=UPI000721CDBA|nr:type III-B CRISPR module RAMP protein Cmr6 [Paenibacillus sp. 32O-W]ALS26935.1 CRISPR type III-B/RAMP module RAMP protein Cmr6 [Paenibacillus sp. 32O-W]
MNVHLALTKLRQSFDTEFNLEKAVSKTDESNEAKASYYRNVIQMHVKNWDTNKDWYTQKFRQYEEMIKTEFSGFAVSFEMRTSCSSLLLIGQGGISVLETPLTLHKTYGLPYIPGTALKGLTSRYYHRRLGSQKSEFPEWDAYYNILFGIKEKAGVISFHDAWITPETARQAFVLDVMTPHHQSYNGIRIGELDRHQGQSRLDAPRDDDAPVPIPFLAVSGTFRFYLTCSPDTDNGPEWLRIARKILMHALEHEGIGGKTNAGYGRLEAEKGEGDVQDGEKPEHRSDN